MKKMFNDYIFVNDEGNLQIEEWDCLDLVEKYETPIYAISENRIRDRFRRIYRAFKTRYHKIMICFAYKANHGLAVKKILKQEGAGAETFGPHELYSALLVGVSPDKIMCNSNNPSEEELTAAVQAGVYINVDNIDMLERVEDVSHKLGIVPKINLRLKTSVELRLRGADRKCGIDLESAYETTKNALKSEKIQLVGYSEHLGGQTTLETFVLQTSEMMDFVGRVKKGFNWQPHFIDLGTGFPTWRKEGHGVGGKDRKFPPIEDYAEAIISKVNEKIEEYDLDEPTLIFEPGRYLVADSAVLLCKVGAIKQVEIGDKTFLKKVFVDANLNNIMRIATSNWYYHIVVANKADREPEEIVDIVGNTGWGGDTDTLGKQRNLPKIERSDLIAILDVGGYAESTATQYLGFTRPASVLVSGRNTEIVRVKESPEDVYISDRIPSRLLAV